jgi:hypothetical protein
MPDLVYPLRNGVRHGFSSVIWTIKSVKLRGIKGINYGRTRDRELLRGNHPDPFAKTIGENSYTCDIEVYLAEFMFVIDQLGAGYGDIFFDCQCAYGADGFSAKTDEILGCTLDTTEVANAQGTGALTRKFALNPLKILFGGLDDLAVPLGPP